MGWMWAGIDYGEDKASADAARAQDAQGNRYTTGGASGSPIYTGGGGGAPVPGVSGGGGGAPLPAAPAANRFEAGLTNSDQRLRNLLDNPGSIQQSAAYKFRVGQGQEALQRSMGARGMLNSGNRLMDLTKYGQDMGSQEYDAQYGRLSDLYKTDSNSYNGNATALNQTQDIANRYQMGTEANTLNRDRFNYIVKQNQPVQQASGISNPWALPGYNGYNY